MLTYVILLLMQSPPPLCQWYCWIDTEQPDWAVEEIKERGRLAWARLRMEEEMEKYVEQRNAEKAEEQRYMHEKKEERKRLIEEEKQRQQELREADRQRKRERAAQAQAAEERGDNKGKWPRWTQDH